MKKLFARFKEIAEKKGPLSAEELQALVESEREPTSHFFQLEHVQFSRAPGSCPRPRSR